MSTASVWLQAARAGDTATLARLLPTCARQTDEQGRTALMLAAAQGHEEAVRLLADSEARILTFESFSALLYAAAAGHAGCVAVLAPFEEAVYTKVRGGILTVAARHGLAQAISYLWHYVGDRSLDPATIQAAIKVDSGAFLQALDDCAPIPAEMARHALEEARARGASHCVDQLTLILQRRGSPTGTQTQPPFDPPARLLGSDNDSNNAEPDDIAIIDTSTAALINTSTGPSYTPSMDTHANLYKPANPNSVTPVVTKDAMTKQVELSPHMPLQQTYTEKQSATPLTGSFGTSSQGLSASRAREFALFREMESRVNLQIERMRAENNSLQSLIRELRTQLAQSNATRMRCERLLEEHQFQEPGSEQARMQEDRIRQLEETVADSEAQAEVQRLAMAGVLDCCRRLVESATQVWRALPSYKTPVDLAGLQEELSKPAPPTIDKLTNTLFCRASYCADAVATVLRDLATMLPGARPSFSGSCPVSDTPTQAASAATAAVTADSYNILQQKLGELSDDLARARRDIIERDSQLMAAHGTCNQLYKKLHRLSGGAESDNSAQMKQLQDDLQIITEKYYQQLDEVSALRVLNDELIGRIARAEEAAEANERRYAHLLAERCEAEGPSDLHQQLSDTQQKLSSLEQQTSLAAQKLETLDDLRSELMLMHQKYDELRAELTSGRSIHAEMSQSQGHEQDSDHDPVKYVSVDCSPSDQLGSLPAGHGPGRQRRDRERDSKLHRKGSHDKKPNEGVFGGTARLAEYGARPSNSQPARSFRGSTGSPLKGELTPLMQAVLHKDLEGVRETIQWAGAQKQDGMTALMMAVLNNFAEAVPYLLDHEAGMQNRNGETALRLALQLQRPKIAELLTNAEGPNTDMYSREGGRVTELMVAAAKDEVVPVWCLIPKQLNLTDHNGRTALMYAARRGSLACVRLLRKEHGAQDAFGETALMMAAALGFEDVVRELVHAESTMKTRRDHPIGHEFTALMFAVQNRHFGVIPILAPFEGGIKDERGWTALDYLQANQMRPETGHYRDALLTLTRYAHHSISSRK
ncbi:Ankyrin repeat protein 1 [Giardia muris]|uniref:Ankyrin repeat protein 1 n=1 Tax=Giardia muris TaxID=5742 RepID=A0A4Z1SNY5_GIAMU|nr:Ankyrin repeat protein 1 [Giardia muris]|eukprot:TNJ27534.1 Ankyrin repeat protein 1 [Giardia muris]